MKVLLSFIQMRGKYFSSGPFSGNTTKVEFDMPYEDI